MAQPRRKKKRIQRSSESDSIDSENVSGQSSLPLPLTKQVHTSFEVIIAGTESRGGKWEKKDVGNIRQHFVFDTKMSNLFWENEGRISDLSDTSLSDISTDTTEVTKKVSTKHICSYCNLEDSTSVPCRNCRENFYHRGCFGIQPYYPLFANQYGEGGLCSDCYEGQLQEKATCCAGSRCTIGEGSLFAPESFSALLSCIECKGILHQECCCGANDLKDLRERGTLQCPDNACLCKLCFYDLIANEL